MRSFLSWLIICSCLVPALAAEEPRAARLVHFTNQVLFRRAASSDWGKARPLLDLFLRDTLYTMAASRAEVRFNAGETLLLAPNTLVVLRPPGKKDGDAELLAGELHSRRSRIVTRGATILPKTADAEFSARLKEDLTTLVSVTRGAAEVEAQGRKVEVRKGFSTVVRPDMPPSPPAELAALPVGGKVAAAAVADLSPPAAEVKPPSAAEFGFLPPDALDSVDVNQGYQLQVAEGRDFSALVLDRFYRTSERPDLDTLLPPGEYFMRAAKIDLLGYKGKFSPPRSIKIRGNAGLGSAY